MYDELWFRLLGQVTLIVLFITWVISWIVQIYYGIKYIFICSRQDNKCKREKCKKRTYCHRIEFTENEKRRFEKLYFELCGVEINYDEWINRPPRKRLERKTNTQDVQKKPE